MKNALRILKIQRSRLKRMIAETADPELRYELKMLLHENFSVFLNLRPKTGAYCIEDLPGRQEP